MFSREGYECKDLLQGRAGLPVVVSQKQDKDFPIWKVQYGVSCLVFPTYEDAMDFCRDRFTRLDGKLHFVYSWKLEPTDKLPKGKKPCLSLRELEKQVNTDLDLLVNIVDGQMTVCELVDRYLKTKTGVRQSTKVVYILFHTGMRISDDDDKIRLNQRKPSKYKGLRRFGPEKNLQRINKFMKERPIFYKNLIQMKENIRFYLRCFYCITKVMILQFNSENRTELARNGWKSV